MSFLLKQLLGAVLEAAVNAFNDWRRDQMLKELGKAEALGEVYESNKKARAVVRVVAHRLHTDPEFAKRVRDEFAKPR